MEKNCKKNRSCGDCIACCVYLRIESPELNKKPMEHCPYLTLEDPVQDGVAQYTGASKEGNCSIYCEKSKRPECCGGYLCAWRAGHGADEDRPDRSLMLFERSKMIGNALEAKPIKDGQEDTTAGRETIDRMSVSTGFPVIVLNFYERRILRIAGRPVEEV